MVSPMKTLTASVALPLAALLSVTGAAHAQTASVPVPPAQAPASQAAPAAPSSSLTRDLNSGPPAPATYLAPAPAPVIAPVAVPPAASPPAASATPPRTEPIPAVPAPQPRAGTITPALRAAPPAAAPEREPVTPAPTGGSAPAVAPVEAAVVTPPPPPPPTVTVLDSAARAALPFTADLPPGFEIVTGRPGPDFRIYTIRRGTQSFVMIYAGPASQFPIYSGQMVEGGGRASILSNEDGVRHAVEHLFQRSTAPAEVHIWTMSLDGADRTIAEDIAQSVDVR